MNLFKGFFLMLIFSVSLIFFSGCGGSNQIPEEVCTYGNMACSLGDYLCQFPEIPPEVCSTVSTICIYLDALCVVDPNSTEYTQLLQDIKEANLKLDIAIAKLNKAKL